MFLAIFPVPPLYHCIYPVFSQKTVSGPSGSVSGRLSPLGGAQGEEHWISVMSKTILGHGSSGLSFWWIRKGLEGINLHRAESLILLKLHLFKNFTWQDADLDLTLTWKNPPNLEKLNETVEFMC